MRPERIQNPESEDLKSLRPGANPEPLRKITETVTYFRTLHDEAESEAMVSREHEDLQRRDRLAAIVLELEKIQGFVAYQVL